MMRYIIRIYSLIIFSPVVVHHRAAGREHGAARVILDKEIEGERGQEVEEEKRPRKTTPTNPTLYPTPSIPATLHPTRLNTGCSPLGNTDNPY